MTTALDGGEGSASRPGRSLPPGKTWYPMYRRLGEPQGRSGQVRKISPPPGFDPRTVQPVASRYNDYATRPTNTLGSGNIINCRCNNNNNDNNIRVSNLNLQLYDIPCTVHTIVTMSIWAPWRHKGSGSIYIHSRSITVVRFKLRPLYHSGKLPVGHWIWSCGCYYKASLIYMSTMTSNLPSALLSFKHQSVYHRALRLLSESLWVICQSLFRVILVHTMTTSKCTVHPDNTQICQKRPSNKFQSTEKGKKKETSAEWMYRKYLWLTNSKTQIVKKDWILWTSTFNVFMMDKWTPLSFSSAMNTWIFWIPGFLFFLHKSEKYHSIIFRLACGVLCVKIEILGPFFLHPNARHNMTPLLSPLRLCENLLPVFHLTSHTANSSMPSGMRSLFTAC